MPPSAIPLSIPPDWKTYTSAAYGYRISYPPDWTVSTENRGTQGNALNVERVVFKQPNYGAPNQFTTISIEMSQAAYTMEGLQCEQMQEVVPGIRGCRRSYSGPSSPPQEMV